MKLGLFNGSYVSSRNTGIGNVSKNLSIFLPENQFRILDPYLENISEGIKIPQNLSPENGLIGHIRRLSWLQINIPRIMKEENAHFFFSPLPETPLFTSIKSVVLAHDLIPIRYPKLSPLFVYNVAYLPLVFHQAKLILCNSLATAKEIHLFFKVPYRKLVPIKLGFDNLKYYPTFVERENFFLVLGRHNPHKNLERLLYAFALIKRYDFKLKFVGPLDKRYSPKLKSLARKLNIHNNCEWKGWVSDNEKLDLLNRCRSLIIPSLWEGFGLPALEAMACGTSVIASSAGALPEFLCESTIFIDPLNVRSIANALTEVLRNDFVVNQAQILGPKAASNFYWEKTANDIAHIIQTKI